MAQEKMNMIELIKKGQTYNEYMAEWRNELHDDNPDAMNDEDRKLHEYKKLNLQRTNRIHKTFSPSESFTTQINELKEKQIWMVLTENWCGDSAQNLPYLFLTSELNPKIELIILKRDQNLDIMDMYLTNGKSRAIPKMVSFDENGDEIFQWGPRPKAAQQLVEKLKADGLSHDEFVRELHLWYGKNRGKELIAELTELLKNLFHPTL